MPWTFFRSLVGRWLGDSSAAGRSGAGLRGKLGRLVRDLDARDWPRRRLAARQLGELRGAALAALAPLVETMVDPREEVRQAARDALDMIDPRWWTRPAVGDAVHTLV